MNFNNFTLKSQEAVQQAQVFATEFGHQQIENAHLLHALFKVDENVIPFLLQKSGVNFSLLKQSLEALLKTFPKVSGGEVMLSRDANQTILNAINLAKKMNDEFVAIEHLVLAILTSKDKTAQLLKDAGLTEEVLKSAINELRKGGNVTSQSAEEPIMH